MPIFSSQRDHSSQRNKQILFNMTKRTHFRFWIKVDLIGIVTYYAWLSIDGLYQELCSPITISCWFLIQKFSYITKKANWDELDETAFGERMNLELGMGINTFQQDSSIKSLIPRTIQALAKETLLWLQGKRPEEHWLTTGMHW